MRNFFKSSIIYAKGYGGGYMIRLLFFPVIMMWRLSMFFLRLTGRIVGMFLGLGFLIAGVLFSITIVGAIIGIPLFIIGLLMIISSFF